VEGDALAAQLRDLAALKREPLPDMPLHDDFLRTFGASMDAGSRP